MILRARSSPLQSVADFVLGIFRAGTSSTVTLSRAFTSGVPRGSVSINAKTILPHLSDTGKSNSGISFGLSASTYVCCTYDTNKTRNSFSARATLGPRSAYRCGIVVCHILSVVYCYKQKRKSLTTVPSRPVTVPSRPAPVPSRSRPVTVPLPSRPAYPYIR